MRSAVLGALLFVPTWGCGRVQYAPQDVSLDSGPAAADASPAADASLDAPRMEADASPAADVSLDALPRVDATDDAAELDAARDASPLDAALSADAPRDAALVPDSPTTDAAAPVDAAPDAGPGPDAGEVLPRRVLGTTGVNIRGMDALADGTPVIVGLVDGAFTVGATAGASVGHRALVAVGERVLDTVAMTDSGYYLDGPDVTVDGDLVIVTGFSRDPVTSACVDATPMGTGDGFVIVYRASDGTCLWQRLTGGAGYETVGHTARWGAGSAIVVATDGSGSGAFGAAFPANAVVALRESDGAHLSTFATSYTPWGVAIDGDTLYVVGEGTVEARDLRMPAAPPLWTRARTASGAMFTQLRDVAVVGTELLIGGSVRYADPAPPGTGGWDDAWTLLMTTDGAERWDRLLGGAGYDYAWHVAAADGVFASGLSVTGNMTVGLTSTGPVGYQALYVERDLATGAVLRHRRLPELFVTGVVTRPGRPRMFSTSIAVYEWP